MALVDTSTEQEFHSASPASISKPTVVLVVGRLFAFAAAFLLSVVLAWLLSPAQFGTYKQLFLLYGTFYGIAQLGMAESLFYFVPRHSREAGRYAANATLILGASGLVCALLLAVGGTEISAWLNNPDLSGYLPLLATFLMLMLLSSALEIGLISRKHYQWAAYTYGLSDLSRALCLVIPVLLWHDLHTMLWGALIFSLLRLGVLVAYFGYDFGAELRPDGSLLRTQLAYALPLAVAVLVETIQVNYHSFSVSHYFDAATFAVYSVGCLHVPLIALVASPATNVMMVLMAENIRERREDAIVPLWHDTTLKLASFLFPMVALLLVVAPVLVVFLFGDQYTASVPIFQLWSLTILNSVFQTGGVLRVFAQTRFLLFINVVQLLIIAALISWFISSFGLFGAVLVTILSLAVARIVTLSRLMRCMGVDISKLLPWRSLAMIGGVSLVAALVPIAIQQVFSMRPLPFLIVAALAYGSAYLLLLWRFGLLSLQERSALTGWIQQVARPLLRPAEPKI